MAIKKPKTTEDYIADGEKFYKSSRDKDINTSNTLYDGQVKSTNSSYDTQVFEQGRAYEDQYRENAVQKEINKRQVAESMANLGLTDSGLNRTQQTAVQLSYGNNNAAIDRQKQNAIDDLEFARRQALDTIKQNRVADIASINKSYDSLALEYGTTKQSSDQAAYQNIITGKISIGETPSDYEIGMSGWSKGYVNSLVKLTKTDSTQAEYKTLVTQYADSGIMPSDDLIEKSGMSKKEVKSRYNNALKAIKTSNTSGGLNGNGGDEKESYIISKTNGKLSRNYTGLLEEAGVSVKDNLDGTVTYTDRNSGKQSTFEKEKNPYTNTINPDVHNGTWASGVGYQPNNITIGGVNYKLQKEEETYLENLGRSQNVFKTVRTIGNSRRTVTQYWMWADDINEYVEVYKKNGDWYPKEN